MIIAVGDPFRLLKTESAMVGNNGCWKEYIKLCLTKCTMLFSEKLQNKSSDLESILRRDVGLETMQLSTEAQPKLEPNKKSRHESLENAPEKNLSEGTKHSPQRLISKSVSSVDSLKRQSSVDTSTQSQTKRKKSKSNLKHSVSVTSDIPLSYGSPDSVVTESYPFMRSQSETKQPKVTPHSQQKLSQTYPNTALKKALKLQKEQLSDQKEVVKRQEAKGIQPQKLNIPEIPTAQVSSQKLPLLSPVEIAYQKLKPDEISKAKKQNKNKEEKIKVTSQKLHTPYPKTSLTEVSPKKEQTIEQQEEVVMKQEAKPDIYEPSLIAYRKPKLDECAALVKPKVKSKKQNKSKKQKLQRPYFHSHSNPEPTQASHLVTEEPVHEPVSKVEIVQGNVDLRSYAEVTGKGI